MNYVSNIIILTSYTLSAYFLFGMSVRLHSERLLKFPNKLFHPTDLLNLPIMALSGYSVIRFTMKSIEILEKIK